LIYLACRGLARDGRGELLGVLLSPVLSGEPVDVQPSYVPNGVFECLEVGTGRPLFDASQDTTLLSIVELRQAMLWSA
jgi:hypothetical protein